MVVSPLQRPGHVGHGRRDPAHRDLLRGKSCTYDTRCCGKGFVHSVGLMDDRVLSACGDRSSGPGLPLPALSAVARLQLQLNSRLSNLVIGMHRANQHFSGESVTLPWLTQSVLVQVRVRPRTSTWHSLALACSPLRVSRDGVLFECSRLVYIQAVAAGCASTISCCTITILEDLTHKTQNNL